MPERELATLKAGLPVLMTVDLPGKTLQGTVDRIAPVVDPVGAFRGVLFERPVLGAVDA